MSETKKVREWWLFQGGYYRPVTGAHDYAEVLNKVRVAEVGPDAIVLTRAELRDAMRITSVAFQMFGGGRITDAMMLAVENEIFGKAE